MGVFAIVKTQKQTSETINSPYKKINENPVLVLQPLLSTVKVLIKAHH